MIYEIRNYHFNPELFEQYKVWAKQHALAYLTRELDLVGFWTNLDLPTEVHGSPMDTMGSANITWIIRWPDMATRNAEFEAKLSTPEWLDTFAKVPGGRSSYHRMEVKFSESLL